MNASDYETLHETKAHVNPRFPYNTYLCTIPLDFLQISPHWHNEIEIIVVKKGRGIITVDMDAHQVFAEDIIIIRPGQIHSIQQQNEEIMEYENILFQSNLLYSTSNDLTTMEYFQPFLELEYHLPCHIHRECSYHFPLAGCIDAIDCLCSRKPAYYELSVKSHLLEFFYILFSCQETPIVAQKNKALEKIKELLLYIEEHYNESITTDDAANLLGFSTSHFMKFFKQQMRLTFTEYLNQYRLTIAGKLLLTSDSSILSISENVGFTNLSYFNRLFKKQYKLTPSEYRKK